MKYFVYLISGIIFSIGLSLSGMVDAAKVKGFLEMGFPDWDPGLIFVLGAAMPVYFVLHKILKRQGRTLNSQKLALTPPKKVDKALIYGSILFGIGWGAAGVCPGPAITHISFLDFNFAIFIVAMFVGMEAFGQFAKVFYRQEAKEG